MGNPRSKQPKKIALVGSTGGGTATLGHTDVTGLVEMIRHHLGCIHAGADSSTITSTGNDEKALPPHPLVTLGTVLFVSLDSGAGFDSATGAEEATLLFLADGGREMIVRDRLDRINDTMRDFEKGIARDFQNNELHGIIGVSCKPSLVSSTLQAAAEMGAPLTGTGGSSLSEAASAFEGLRLIGNAGGSVGTTPETKAVSFASAFASEWGLGYDPAAAGAAMRKRTQTASQTNPSSTATATPTSTTADRPPTWKSVLNSCLPGFWGVMLLKRILRTTPVGDWLPEGDRRALEYAMEFHVLPMVCAVVMATSRRKVESVQMAALLAAAACRGSILGGLLSGWCAAILEERLLYASILRWKLPATFTNLLTGGLVGVVTATLMAPLSPYLGAATGKFRNLTAVYLWGSAGSSNDNNDIHESLRLVFSSLLGCLFCYGSKVGWYHSIFLPLILIEMELGDPSMLGALDVLALVLVCAGVCLGLLVTGNGEDKGLARRGMTTNLLYGDFVEAYYPHAEKYPLVNAAGYAASALSSAILTTDCRSSAYLPFPAAVWLADDREAFLAASLIAFFIPFLGTVVNHTLFVRKRKSE